MKKQGWTYRKDKCSVCHKPLPTPHQSRLLYHRGTCKSKKRLEQKRADWFKHRGKNLRKKRERYLKSPQQAKESARRYRLKHPEKLKEWSREAAKRFSARWKRMSEKEKNVLRAYQRDYGLRIKKEVFLYYSNGRCDCCDEPRIEFLSIDHINGGGTKHRRLLNKSGQRFCLWLKAQGYPKGYRVLCFNCNQSIGLYGYCPHKKGSKK